jgi:aspartate/methionine/tyrosine aminotransferase
MITPFKLERYFALHEFKARYLLSASDCESLAMSELLSMADKDSIQRWSSLNLGYTESLGLPVLREEIARLYQNVPAGQILTLTPEEGIFIAMQTLLKPGDHVICLFPGYQSLYEIAHSMGCEVTPWALVNQGTTWQLDFQALEAALRPNTRLLVVNFPHNPTGFLPTRAEQQRIVDFARAHHLVLFSDEMYRLLEYDSAKRLPPACDLYERGISLSGLSKSFALPGLRVGWLATQDEHLFHNWMLYKDYTTICSSAPSEILALMALRARDKIIRRNLDIITANLALANPFFAEFERHFDWLPPLAGSIAFPHLKTGQSVDAFCEDVLKQKDVMIVPGSMFDFPGNHFRLGLGRKNFPEAMRLLGEYLRNQC